MNYQRTFKIMQARIDALDAEIRVTKAAIDRGDYVYLEFMQNLLRSAETRRTEVAHLREVCADPRPIGRVLAMQWLSKGMEVT